MRKLLIILLLTVFSFTLNAQKPPRFALFSTENMWTFIKLDTRNGRMWQVQYSINDDNARTEFIMNYNYLCPIAEEENGRFTLVKTQNMWTFILLDQNNGRMWQVQYSLKSGQSGIVDEIK